MSLIIALVLIAIVLCKVSSDKSKDAEFDREKSKQDEMVLEWKNLYVDQELESKLESCIADENNYMAICGEIREIVSNTDHWRDLLDGNFLLNESQILSSPNYKKAQEKLRKNQRIALDIMLANRGKISMMAFSFGYKAYIKSGSRYLKESAYEYADMILKLLRSRGANVELYCYCHLGEEAYYWKGTHPQHKNNVSTGEIIMPFDKETILRSYSIPECEQ